MRHDGIARTERVEALRTAAIGRLGEVEPGYLEPSGKSSALRPAQDSVRTGPPVLSQGARGGREPVAEARLS